MSLLGSGTLGSLLGSLSSSDIAGRLVQSLGPSVVQTVLDQLNGQGYGAKVNSWLGRGPNQPLTVDEVRTALGDQRLQDLAKSVGIPADKLSEVLAQHLPNAVDQASKNGSLPAAPR